MSKEKDDNISVETPEKKKKSKRLDGMLESMNKRSDPVSTHRIATEYFQSFKVQRNIQGKETSNLSNTAVGTAIHTAVVSTDDVSEVYKREQIDLLHTQPEDKVYNAIRSEVRKSGTNVARVGLTKLKKLTGLSDKTIRVSVHNLELKKSIRIEEPSIGIYGRMFSILEPDQIVIERKKESIIIDKTTKSIIPR